MQDAASAHAGVRLVWSAEGENGMAEGDAKKTAQTLIRLHGGEAEARAQDMLAFCKANGNTVGARVWQRVLVSLAELRKPATSKVVH